MQYPFRKMKKRNYFENTFSYFMMYKSIVIILMIYHLVLVILERERRKSDDYMTLPDLVKKKLLKYCYFF